MSEEGAFIRDVRSLEQLNNMIGFTGQVMANIEENVSRYLNGVKDVLEKQLDIIREKLEEAQERLSEAEDALSSCEASQTYDEETGEYSPSCSLEEHAVAVAQREVDKWQDKYNEGKRIVDECKGEIDDYNAPGSLLMPPGGHYLIINMCESQTPKATQQLQDFIKDVYEYKQNDVGGDPYSVRDATNPAVKEEDKPMTDDERFDAFKKNIQGVKDEQQEDASVYNIQDANRAMRCPCCGLPLQLCTCRNLHVDVNLYQ
jgi:DNA repair exonuclease SbcCD ATPase subunit